MTNKKCRFCDAELNNTFVDLGMSPLANSYVKPENLNKGEKYYPLHTYVCSNCLLVQLEEFESPEGIFSDYAYFSSYSTSWLDHCQQYVQKVTSRFEINKDSQVVEIASNDGYLLQYFVQKDIPVLGIEPAKNVAVEAEKKGIKTITEFFGTGLAEKLVSKKMQADLLIANNVIAHVPNINDFVKGMKKLLKPNGIITLEFPHLLNLINKNQFDTIYHEHFSYISIIALKAIFEKNGLDIFDIEKLSTHGGSLRVYAKHIDNKAIEELSSVDDTLYEEKAYGLDKIETYVKFNEKVKEIKRNVLNYLINLKKHNKIIVGYGAPAKGNTLLNYCGAGVDFIDYTVDLSPHKQGLYLPGTHIPTYSPDRIKETKPDYVLILPWNLKNEIMNQIGYIKEWDGKFITLIPDIEVY